MTDDWTHWVFIVPGCIWFLVCCVGIVVGIVRGRRAKRAGCAQPSHVRIVDEVYDRQPYDWNQPYDWKENELCVPKEWVDQLWK